MADPFKTLKKRKELFESSSDFGGRGRSVTDHEARRRKEGKRLIARQGRTVSFEFPTRKNGG